ncbi:Hypothetical_protein [Hexamita inflata]|uniref:Hypothetical_protein n=1 Tax=Hexamita inflata TaxID=28002 RepID=A0AA86NDX0_9EUKA|nr:Hypothetical protein HINF_LOCUS5379 [Hexamita inflata]
MIFVTRLQGQLHVQPLVSELTYTLLAKMRPLLSEVMQYSRSNFQIYPTHLTFVYTSSVNCKFTRMIISFRYTYVRRTICVSKEAMERLPLSSPEGSLIAMSMQEREAQQYEPIIDHTKQSWYFSNATSALTLDAADQLSNFQIQFSRQ